MSRQVGAKTTRQYSPSKLEAAVKMVEAGQMSKKKAALTFGVPRTTIIDKISGRYRLGSKPGRKTVLTRAEEQVLVDYCKLMAEIGYPLKSNELLKEVKRVLDHDQRPTPFKDNLPGKDWFSGFKRRHPEISHRSAMTLGHQRAIISKAMVHCWFDGLKNYLKKEVPDWEAMLEDPRRCFNADESGFPLCVNTGKVLAERGAKHVYQVTSSSKQQLTAMVCFNALGQYLPPLIVFPGERFRDSGIHDFPEAVYGHSKNGWMDSDLFVEFLKQFNSFVESKSITKPVILYVDGHSTHMSLEAATFCRDKNIILYCLLANATHLLQPCDVGFFGPMKSAWKREVKEWHVEHVCQSFTKRAFPAVFRKAWYRVCKLENALHGFQRCGLFPLCADNVDASKLKPSKLRVQNEVKEPAARTEAASSAQDAAASVKDTAASVSDAIESVQDATSSVQDVTASVKDATASVKDATASTIDNDALLGPNTGDTYTNETALPGTSVVDVSLTECSAQSESPSDVTPASSTISFAGDNFTLTKVCSTVPTPGPSGAKTIVNKDSNEFVSPSFGLLSIPEPPKKKVSSNIRHKLPKAISGSEAIKLMTEKQIKKQNEEAAKQKRKEENAAKKILREQEQLKKKEEKLKKQQEQLKKKQEREEKKKERERKKLLKTVLSKKRKLDESSSESEYDEPKFDDSDDEYDELALCPGCQTDDGGLDEWVSCTMCTSKWHTSCTGDALLLELPVEQLPAYPFVCENCYI